MLCYSWLILSNRHLVAVLPGDPKKQSMNSRIAAIVSEMIKYYNNPDECYMMVTYEEQLCFWWGQGHHNYFLGAQTAFPRKRKHDFVFLGQRGVCVNFSELFGHW